MKLLLLRQLSLSSYNLLSFFSAICILFSVKFDMGFYIEGISLSDSHLCMKVQVAVLKK